METQERKTVDVIIPTFQPGRELKILLDRLHAQTYPIHKIYVLDTESGQFPEEVLTRYESLQLVKIPSKNFDHGGTRDKGARLSQADIIVFMTQDAIPADDRLIEELVRGLRLPGAGISYARQLPREECSLSERFARNFNYPPKSRIKGEEDRKELGIKTYFCSDVCAAYHRRLYLSLGGFEQKTIFNEDMIMGSKVITAGHKIVYRAEAKVIHSHDDTWWKQLQRSFDMAVSQAQHPEIFANVSSEQEGIKLVKESVWWLCKKGKPHLILPFCIGFGVRFVGYRLGLSYRHLPKGLIRVLTMNKGYWGFS